MATEEMGWTVEMVAATELEETVEGSEEAPVEQEEVV